MNIDKFKALAAKYALVVGVIVGAFLIIGGIAFFVYSAMSKDNPSADDAPPLITDGPDQSNDGSDPSGQNDYLDMFTPPDRTTALVLGTDPTAGLSDVMLLVTFDATADKIDVISIPRDTLITLPQEDVTALHALGRRSTPSSGVMKLNELHSYAGAQYGPEYSKKFIQTMLNVDIDYTVVISTSAFRSIVDAAGGIYMNVRPEGYHYSDPTPGQKLYIDVPGGYQLLKGKEAEGVVRYRHDYRNGDLDRIPVQQEFMKCFFEQILTRENITKNWQSFIATIISYVKTDFTIDDIPMYLTSVEKIKPENIEFHSLPGESRDIDGGSYYIYSAEKGKIMLDEIFTLKNPTPTEKPAEKSNIIIDKTLTIQILNGTHANKLGSRTSEQLTAAGYTVKNVATYQGVKQETTRIVVKNKDLGEQFKSFFKNAVIEVDLDIPSPYNAVIIIGTGEV